MLIPPSLGVTVCEEFPGCAREGHHRPSVEGLYSELIT